MMEALAGRGCGRPHMKFSVHAIATTDEGHCTMEDGFKFKGRKRSGGRHASSVSHGESPGTGKTHVYG